MIDSVTITAHDKFDEIIAEAQSGNSIFNADGVIYADYEKQKQIHPVQIQLFDDNELRGNILERAGLDYNNEKHKKLYNEMISTITNVTNQQKKMIPTQKVNSNAVKEEVVKDLGTRFCENNDLTHLLEVAFNVNILEEIINKTEEKIMYIPKIRTEQLGEEKYIIQDFDLDLHSMTYTPIENDILIKNLLDSHENVQIIRGHVIDYDTILPEKLLVDNIRSISEIDYEKCPFLIQKIVLQFLNYYRSKYSEEKVRNICLMYRKDIISNFKSQLLWHLAISYEGIVDIVQGIETIVNNNLIDISNGLRNINEAPAGENIKSITYEGANKAVTSPFKFDSDSERKFAIACENSPEVIQWLRPAANQFNITYNRGKRYEPDFVVETEDMYYLVEVKDKTKMNDPIVLSKKDRAIKYCKVATEYNLANGHKGFKYLFIPHDQIETSSSFDNLKNRFLEE